MSVFEVLNRQLNSISFDFEMELYDNDNNIENINCRYLRMRLAEIHGAYCVFSYQMTQSEIESYESHFERVCNLLDIDYIDIADSFYLYDWKM